MPIHILDQSVSVAERTAARSVESVAISTVLLVSVVAIAAIITVSLVAIRAITGKHKED